MQKIDKDRVDQDELIVYHKEEKKVEDCIVVIVGCICNYCDSYDMVQWG